jgi:hypothetical protein
VGKVSTSIRDGELIISEVTVANPPGFKNRNAVSLGGIEAAVDFGNLDIKRLVINNPEIVIEELGGDTNFSIMQSALNRQGAGSTSEATPGERAEPVIVIRNFRMNGSRAAFESQSLDTYTNVKIDAIEMNDLRGTPTELAQVIAAKILKEVSQEAATEMIKAQAKRQFKDTKSKVTSKLKDLLGDDDEEEEEEEVEDSGN